MSRKKQDAPRVNILRTDSEDDLAIAMTAVRKVRGIADLVLVSLHWGEEYTTISSRWQRRVAGELIEAGADVILGHHPHVLQPIEFHTSRNGRQGIIAFSLGNFIASQNYGITSENMAESRALRGDGTIFTIFACKETGKTTIIRAEFIPTWMLYDRVGNIMVNRPVNLAREIKRLEDSLNRTEAEESTLQLLTYRKKSISAQLLQKQAP
jgi:poly-gamma-glutamate capsule biosynthesis protein CapA/YwtB (metallophosphatase superfamily)